MPEAGKRPDGPAGGSPSDVSSSSGQISSSGPAVSVGPFLYLQEYPQHGVLRRAGLRSVERLSNREEFSAYR